VERPAPTSGDLARVVAAPDPGAEEATMDSWIDRLAVSLGEDALTPGETARLLGLARDVAHGVERKITPLAAFLIGSSVGRSLARGTPRTDALDAAFRTVQALLPEPGPQSA
jgi:hypothetical protein